MSLHIFYFFICNAVSLASNPQPGGPGPCIYAPCYRVPRYPPGTGFPFRCILRQVNIIRNTLYPFIDVLSRALLRVLYILKPEVNLIGLT
jgi:hypothetical protein